MPTDTPPPVRWGILATGKIASDFTVALKAQGAVAEVVAVASRSQENADAFGDKFGVARRYASYAELCQDPGVDAIYVASPHNYHHAHSLMCLRGGKHVLCEKPMTLNAGQAREVLAEARARGLFFMQGVWSRFFPAYLRVADLVGCDGGGELGDVRNVHCSFGFNDIWDIPRIQRRDLAGGATLDIGIYAVQAAVLAFGRGMPSAISATGHLNEDGVDMAAAVTLDYGDGKLAVLNFAVNCNLQNECVISGDKASVRIHAPFWCATDVSITKHDLVTGASADPDTEHFDLPPNDQQLNFTNSNGFQYEVQAVCEAIQKGETSLAGMSDEESIVIMQILDEVRKQLGVIYPEEE